MDTTTTMIVLACLAALWGVCKLAAMSLRKMAQRDREEREMYDSFFEDDERR